MREALSSVLSTERKNKPKSTWKSKWSNELKKNCQLGKNQDYAGKRELPKMCTNIPKLMREVTASKKQEKEAPWYHGSHL
jgi:hypothetical protein